MAWFVYAAYGIWLGGSWAYHKLNDEHPPPPPPDSLKVPLSEDGAPISLIFGRCLSKQPILAWAGNAEFTQRLGQPDGTYQYTVDLLFVAGVPFRNGITSLHGIYLGERRLGSTTLSPSGIPPNFGGSASTNSDNSVAVGVDAPAYFFSTYEFGDGNTAQDFLSSDAAFKMNAAGIADSAIPGYLDFATVFLQALTFQSTIPALSFEVSSFPSGFSSYPTRIGDDCNPVRVISELLTGGLGKIGIPTSVIDSVTFNAAGKTLADEGHGYSRCLDDRQSASDAIKEILEQIDAVLYEDPRDSKIKIKLIRADYDLNATLLIHPGNCDAVENYASRGQTDGINAVNVQFTDRANGYATGSARAADNAAITASGESPVEITLRYPGCCTRELAENLAARELAARSQPLARCSAIVDRSFRNVMPGDVVRLSWPEYHLNEKVFRVGQVDRGTFTDGRIRLDLVQDFFYVHRRRVHPEGPVTPFPTTRPPLLVG